MKHSESFLSVGVVCLCLFNWCGNVLQAQPKSLNSIIADMIAEHLGDEHDYGSVSIGVFVDKQPQYYFYGNASDEAMLVSPNEHTLYRIGSLSKVITTSIYQALVNENLIVPSQAISTLLPDSLSRQNSVLKELTLEQLATHTAGFPSKPFNIIGTIEDKDNPYANYSVADMYRYLSTYHPLEVDNRAFSKDFNYSHFGIGLLGHLLERATGESYMNLVEKYVSRPLNCLDICLVPNDEQLERATVGHNFAGRAVAPIDFLSLYGSEGLWASLEDMMKFVYANMEGSLSYLLATQEPYCSTPMRHVRACTGWYAIDRNKQVPTVYTHSGRVGGYSNYVGFIPDWGLGVVVMSNSTQHVDNVGIELLSKLIDYRRAVNKKAR